MKKVFVILCVTAFLLGVTGISNAALTDLGNGMVYDSALDVTWLQDANYAQTSGYDADGRMDWYIANTWVSNLDYGGYDDWRLPTTVGGLGYADNGELNHLFYDEGIRYSNPGIFTSVMDANANLHYWTGSVSGGYPWTFSMNIGYQGRYNPHHNYFYALPVRNGRAVVPIPGAVWLLGSGLIGIVGIRKKLKNR